MRLNQPLSSLSRRLYVALAALTVITVIVSIQSSIGLRQVRNLTILASYGVGVALLFADKWARPAAVWAGVGLLSGLLYFGYETWSISRARRERSIELPASAGLSTILLGVVAWPLALPEVIELTLADAGLIGTGEATPPDDMESAPP